MIQYLSCCPHCECVLGFNWLGLDVVPNPDSVQPICPHVIWLAGAVHLDQVDRKFPCFNYMQDRLAEMARQVEVREILCCLEVEEGELSADFKCDRPTLYQDHIGYLDAVAVYAWNPTKFFRAVQDQVRNRALLGELYSFEKWYGPPEPIDS